eukprot:15365291-Ditylum_brightwellii.AAC.2
MHTGLPLLNQNNFWPVCLHRPTSQNCLVPCDSVAAIKQHGLGGFVVFPSCQHGMLPVLEKAPVDIACHIVVPVCDLGLEELLASSNKVSHSFILLLVEAAKPQDRLLVNHTSHIICQQRLFLHSTDQCFHLSLQISPCKPEVRLIHINLGDLCLLQKSGAMEGLLVQDPMMGIISEVRRLVSGGRSVAHEVLLCR